MIPPATGLRTPWDQLPEALRTAVTDVLGAPVVQAETQPGGFSPGAAARVRTADGRRAFVKAVSADTNRRSPAFHRAEARNTAALPTDVPAPALLGTYDDGTWVALVLEDIAGRQPQVPWRRQELERVLDALTVLVQRLTPSPFTAPRAADALAADFSGWSDLADGKEPGAAQHLDAWTLDRLPWLAELAAPWAEAVSGATLAHADLRADNILLADDGRVVFVDWPHALRRALVRPARDAALRPRPGRPRPGGGVHHPPPRPLRRPRRGHHRPRGPLRLLPPQLPPPRPTRPPHPAPLPTGPGGRGPGVAQGAAGVERVPLRLPPPVPAWAWATPFWAGSGGWSPEFRWLPPPALDSPMGWRARGRFRPDACASIRAAWS